MTVSRYTPETFSRPVQSREKRGLDKRGGCATESQRIRISVPRFPKPSRNNPRGRHVRRRLRTRVRDGDEGGGGLARLTYDKFNALLPPCLPSLLTLMAQGHTGYYYFHSFPHVCLSVCPSVRTSVPFFLSTFVSSVWLYAFSRTAEISFRMLSRASPEASLFPPPRTRDGALSFLRATRDAKSSRPPLLLERYLSCAASCRILVVELCKDGKWNTYITY